MRLPRFARYAALGSIAPLLFACTSNDPTQTAQHASDNALTPESHVHPVLRAHSAEFERKVYQVTEGVWSAVGFGLANSILIEGDDGVIIVDVMESRENAEAVMAEFRKITDKPVKALIYTHNHADHVFGGLGFVPDGNIDVYAHSTTNYYIDRIINQIRPVITNRSGRMFGNLLEKGDDGLINAGIGMAVNQGHGGGAPTLIRPNKTFDDELDIEVAGVKIKLVHAPGETNDQIFVWLPEKKVLMPGDNIYKAFPNLYTIRGTLYRDVLGWAHSLDKMRDMQPEYLVPSHTRPVSGQAVIANLLTDYRDAIQYVHDQTIRGMNHGMTPDELVETVKLPKHLAEHPYLQELYGTVEWSVRNIFNGYLGWFNGDSATLSRASQKERGEAMVSLAGGEQKLLDNVQQALADDRNRWAAELANYLLFIDPEHEQARQLKAQALRKLGKASISPNGRNFYLTQALELEGKTHMPKQEITPENLELIKTFPAKNFLSAMSVALDPAKSEDTNKRLSFTFPDVDKTWTLHVRRGVAVLNEGLDPEAELNITVNKDSWIELVTGARSFPGTVASGDLEIDGGMLKLPELISFLTMFDPAA